MIGNDGMTAAATGPGTVVVFRRVRDRWERDRELPFSLDETGGLAGVRSAMVCLTVFLGNCRTVVARSASGAVFFGLEKARCTVFELPGRPEDILDPVWQDMMEEQGPAPPLPAGSEIPVPLEIAPGHFTISIKDIQGKRPELSSKQVLSNFVRNGKFTELEIACDHVPPWIEAEAFQRGYELTSERAGMDDLRVVLRRNPGGCC
jgi:Fe-only nitrogenase accessory protein AnfO